MAQVARDGQGFVVDADLLAAMFCISQAEVQEEMRSGAITSTCEAGEGEDAGRWRLTFRRGESACRLTVDDAGTVLQRARFPVRRREAPDATP